ncbi:hypothetical protein AHAS_Ahas17G0169400 [Arachis hypogaea]
MLENQEGFNKKSANSCWAGILKPTSLKSNIQISLRFIAWRSPPLSTDAHLRPPRAGTSRLP